MGFWAWFWVWVGLVVGSLVFFAAIGYFLFAKAEAVVHQLGRTASQVEPLMTAIDTAAKLDERESDLLADTDALTRKRELLLKRKNQKRSQRQRRLRGAIKDIDLNESRFH
jgi:hypothetical protein